MISTRKNVSQHKELIDFDDQRLMFSAFKFQNVRSSPMLLVKKLMYDMKQLAGESTNNYDNYDIDLISC